jgi:hypothetical protein
VAWLSGEVPQQTLRNCLVARNDVREFIKLCQVRQQIIMSPWTGFADGAAFGALLIAGKSLGNVPTLTRFTSIVFLKTLRVCLGARNDGVSH